MTTDNDRAARLIHHRREGLAKGDPVALPLSVSSMFHLPGDPAGVPGYGRSANQTWEATEAALALLEDAPCLLFPSGMAAIAAPFFALLKSGDRILLPSDGYFASRALADGFLSRMGVTIETRPTARFEEGGFAGYAMVLIETPSNPFLDLCDLRAVCAAVRAAGGISVVDNTTSTPFGQRPLDLGADMVVASDTKAPGGHSDLLLGHVATRDADLMEAVRGWRGLSGAIPGGLEAWLLHRSLETLEMRFDRMCTSAQIIAERLRDHPLVRAVRYPGLPGDPGHALARAQMARFGFLISVTLADADAAEGFIDGCALLQPATSFGGVHSSAERRIRWGDAVDPGAVRLSVGCEPVEELWAALAAALD
ncbi:cystathionine gamma-lyase [Marivivens marinus]|uniref:cystathionine gamma-lyase n=1 Tax=Marivivens marinus TaxID=3110173 RepID=UPI003B848537